MVSSAVDAAVGHTQSKADTLIAAGQAARRTSGPRAAAAAAPRVEGKKKDKIQPPQSDSPPPIGAGASLAPSLIKGKGGSGRVRSEHQS